MSSSNIINRDKKRGKRVNEHAETEHNVAADNSELERNRRPLEIEKFRSLTDIYRDPACELPARRRIAYPSNINRRFVQVSTENEDEDKEEEEEEEEDDDDYVVDDDDDDATLGGCKRNREGIESTKECEDFERNGLMVLASHFNIQGNESMMQSSSSVERISQLTATIMTHAGEAGPSSSQHLANPSMQTRPKRVIKKPARYAS